MDLNIRVIGTSSLSNAAKRQLWMCVVMPTTAEDGEGIFCYMSSPELYSAIKLGAEVAATSIVRNPHWLEEFKEIKVKTEAKRIVSHESYKS